MKLVLVASMAAVLAMGISGEAEAHGYEPAVGGSFYWADDGYVIGFNYGAPVVAPYYGPTRYAYRPYRHGYRSGRHHGHHKSYRKGYKRGYGKGYGKGYRKGHRYGHRGHGRRDWDD